MNPPDWEDAFRRLQRCLDPINSGVNNSMGNAFSTNNYCDTYYEHSRYTVDEPHNSTGVNVGWEELSLPSSNFYNKESEGEDPDGDLLEIDEEDSELARKRKELREIEEQIMLKKAAIALKKVEPIMKKTTPLGLSCNEQSATCKGETLRDRVNLILLQRHSLSFLSKVRSPKKRTNSSSLSRDGKLLEEHPLKLRVKALMKRRCCDPCVQPTNTEVPDVTPPPSQSVASPTKGENSDNKGFQRFLSVLNKGVDIDLLSRIVNDDSEDLALGEELLNIQPPAVENKPEPGESQRSNSGASLPDPSRASSGERETEALITERSHNERLSLLDEEKKTDGGDDSFGSSSRSKSPPAVKKKKKKEEEKPKVDEQREQLQNILKTLGLSLEVEEMSKLADRTQERLYGKKHEGRWGAESRGEHESHRKGTHRHYRNSSSSSSSSSAYSSSSSSSTSRSTSRSFSTSPSRLCSSHSRDSKRRRASERSCSGSRSRDGLTLHDGNQDSKEAQRPRDVDKDRKDSKQISTYHHPYPQEQTYSYSHPAAILAFPDYSLSQYSQYTAYCTGTYSAATNSYSAFTQGAIPPPLDSSQYPYPQNSDLYFPGSVVAPNMVYPHHDPFEDINLLVNPDLSKSEGQMGSAGCRYLRVISTKQSTTRSCLKELTKGHKRKGKYIRKCRVWFQKLKERKRQQKLAAKRAKQSKDSAGKVEASRGDEDDSETGQSKEEKIQPTEEEIKVNLRKKLEAFNQKVKKQVTQTANPLTSQTG